MNTMKIIIEAEDLLRFVDAIRDKHVDELTFKAFKSNKTFVLNYATKTSKTAMTKGIGNLRGKTEG